jgi:hypothetical protein
MENSRRTFIKQAAIAGAGVLITNKALSAKSYKRIIGANDRVRLVLSAFPTGIKARTYPAL